MSITDSQVVSSFSQNNDDDGLNFKRALVVVGAVLGFIVSLLILRFGCNVAIDLCILCDLQEARRTLRDGLCFWKRRGVVAPSDEGGVDVTMEQQRQQQGGSSSEEQSRREQDAVERLLQGLSDTERSIVISTLLKGVPVEKQDLHQWKQRYTDEQKLVHQHHPVGNSVSSDQHSKVSSVLSLGDSVSSDQEQQQGGVSCSICLHDFQEGNIVFIEPNCQHVFHRDCIVEWCSSSGRIIKTSCPYCRQSMITQEQLQSVLETRRRHNDNNSHGDCRDEEEACDE